MRLVPLALLLAACSGGDADPAVASSAQDADGDGFLEFEDCDDADGSAYPGAPEICDGLDNDCDGLTDGADPDFDGGGSGTWYADIDGDGFGDPDAALNACGQPEGSVDDASDCDDSKPTVYPGANEACGDGIDQDCDGLDARCAPGGILSVSGADATVQGASGERAGAALAGGVDLNEDGRDDFIVGVPKADNGGATDAGALAFFLDPIDDTVTLPTGASAFLPGLATGDGLGGRLALMADGAGWLLLAAGPRSASGGSEAGLVVLFQDGLPASVRDGVSFTGGSFDRAGSSIALAADWTGDGAPDLLVGGPGDSTGGAAAGVAWLVPSARGASGGALIERGLALTGAAGDSAGEAVANLGDVDGDGIDDLAVGAPGHGAAGAVYLVFGPVGGAQALEDSPRIDGDAAGDRLGLALAGGADLDEDGHLDLILGSPTANGEKGRVWVLTDLAGASPSLADAAVRIDGSSFDRLGQTLAVVGDLDADGHLEFAVGGDQADEAFLFYGPLGGVLGVIDAQARMTGSGGDEIGGALAGAGDIDGDGYDELLVSDPDVSEAYLYYGGRR